MPRVDPRWFFTPPFATKRNFPLFKFKGTLSLVRRASRRIKEVLSVAADYTPFRNDDTIQGRQRAAVRKWNERTREEARKHFILFSTLTHIWSDSSINCYRRKIVIGNIILSDYITVLRRARLSLKAMNCLLNEKRNKCMEFH